MNKEGCWKRVNDERVGWLRDASSWEEHKNALDEDKEVGSLII